MTMADDNPDERVASFRLLAKTAQQMAAKAETETAPEDYLRIAAEWLRLADEIEKSGK